MTSKWEMAKRDKRRRLNAQLCENTGRHFMDSGGEDGRAWQRNARHQPIGKPAETLVWRIYGGRLEAEREQNTLDVLDEWLDDGPAATRARRSFAQFIRRSDQQHNSWPETLAEWADFKGWTIGGGENTYNAETDLSQHFQWREIEDEYGDVVVALQTHNGADIRGGYSAPTFWVPTDAWPRIEAPSHYVIIAPDGEDGYVEIPRWGEEIPAFNAEDIDLPWGVTIDDLWHVMVGIMARGQIDAGRIYGYPGVEIPIETLEDIWDFLDLTAAWAGKAQRTLALVLDDGARALGACAVGGTRVVQGEMSICD